MKDEVMNDAEFYQWFRKQHPAPYFTFPDLATAGELRFEKLLPENAHHLFAMFRDDASPFVDERFKGYDSAKEYAQWLQDWGLYSPKHGSQDYLFSVEGRGYAGILHLYDLSLETFADNHKRAWIGFATREDLRRRRITEKAVRHLVRSVFEYYPGIDFIHTMTDKQNTAAQQFILRCGFLTDPTERLSQDDFFYVLSRPGLS